MKKTIKKMTLIDLMTIFVDRVTEDFQRTLTCGWNNQREQRRYQAVTRMVEREVNKRIRRLVAIDTKF